MAAACEMNGHTYSKAMDQPRPRKCVKCGKAEITLPAPPPPPADPEAAALAEFKASAIELKSALEAANRAQVRYKAALAALSTAVAGDFTPQ